MQPNEGTADRIVRILLALIFGYLALIHVGGGIGTVVFGILAVIALITAAVGFCMLYQLFGIRTCPSRKAK